MEIAWMLGILFVASTVVFMAIALLYPEWVGITGKVAKEFEKQQRGDSEDSTPKE